VIRLVDYLFQVSKISNLKHGSIDVAEEADEDLLPTRTAEV